MSKLRFSALITDKGTIDKEAETFVKERFMREVEMLINFATTENELRIIGGVLSSLIGNKVADRIRELNGKQR